MTASNLKQYMLSFYIKGRFAPPNSISYTHHVSEEQLDDIRQMFRSNQQGGWFWLGDGWLNLNHVEYIKVT